MLLLNLIRAIYRNVHRIFTRGGTRMTLPPPPHHAQGGLKLHLLLPHMCTPMLEMQQYKNFEGGGEGVERGGGGGGQGTK